MSREDAMRSVRQLLDTAEDYFRGGFRRDRPVPGEDTGSAEAAGETSGEADLEVVAREVSACTRCALARTRTIAVPGEGAARPLVLAVGEGPGAEEDASGRPFVGPAGQYLDKWLAAIGLDRQETCFIANVVKCRPPGNRDPGPEEITACRGYLDRQIAALRPRAILALGRFAAQVLTGATQGITLLRGRTHACGGVPLVATYHPSAVLRDASLRAAVWDDLKRLKALLGDG
jgi:uracil-DNA glycosylase family 4